MNDLWAYNLYKKERKEKIWLKEEEGDLNKWSSLWANHQYLQIWCKLKWAKLEKP